MYCEQAEFLPEGEEIAGESFEDTVCKVRNSLAFQFAGMSLSSQVIVTNGRRSATFSIGPRDYDLDSGFTGDRSIIFQDVAELNVLSTQIANHKPVLGFRVNEQAKGIVPIGAEAESVIRSTPGMHLRLSQIRMPYGQGKPVNFYSGQQS